MKHITLGILGGGQLGRMSALAAARLGIAVVIYTPEEASPASLVAAETIVGAYEDQEKLRQFAEKVDVISYEFENIPVETIRYLKAIKPVYPDERLLDVAQDRLKEKKFLNDTGIQTARWAHIQAEEDAEKFLQSLQTKEFIIKTTRFGYDGKGQAKCTLENVAETLRMFSGHDLIGEEIIDFTCEISVIVARDSSGKIETYGPMLNEHKNHILSRTIVPAKIPDDISKRAVQITADLATALNVIGVMTLEMFVTKDGEILANEIAPRTHNSGHWSIDACTVSQFEQHVRAVCGLPLGSVNRHSDAEMLNLIGDDVSKIEQYLTTKGACIHLYGKHEARAGRKMGHITLLKPKT
jgi:5-(carboxyamino)imidazole ribonucleotide synthase